jgi:hypothetical protein
MVFLAIEYSDIRAHTPSSRMKPHSTLMTAVAASTAEPTALGIRYR